MITINKAKTSETATYYWDSKKERFGGGDAYLNHGFRATHAIVVDAGLTAQEIDVVLSEVLS